MSEPTVIPPGGGEVVGDSPERRVEILSDHDALNATWARLGPRREGADLHVHRRHTDLFYVLEGELTVMLGPEGGGVVHTPSCGFGAFLRALHNAGDEELAAARAAFDQQPAP